jgi:cell division protein FtsI/penicillin-binding protein 2
VAAVRAVTGEWRPGLSVPLRLGTICAVLAGAALVLVFRLFTFQIAEVDKYRTLAMDERSAKLPIPARRGGLLDTNGHPIAVSVMYESVSLLGAQIKDPDKTANALAPILGLNANDIRGKIDRTNQVPLVLKANVTSAVSEQIKALSLAGVYTEKEPVRRYPEGSLASQILGFVGRDREGLGGLEMSYDTLLAGSPGLIETERDSAGGEISQGRRVLTPPQEGADLVLTLDRYIQRTAERLLAEAVIKNKARGGLILVMDPATGGIIAAASNPTYSLTEDEIYKPEQAGLFKSTIVTDQFEPGSTMKVVTMASAIEEGLLSPGTTYTDTGFAQVGGVGIRNWDGAANGTISMTTALAKSSNVVLQWVAGLLGPNRFYQHLEGFGFGEKTGVRLPGEVSGTVRTPESDLWTRVDLATNSYGQGIAVTPLQMLNAVSSFASDGKLMRPQLVKEVRTQSGTQAQQAEVIGQTVSPRTARTILSMMEEVGAQEAYAQYRIPGYRIALKTGTADTPTNLGYALNLTFASTVALFPAENPRFAVLVRLDGPEALYGGTTAVPVLHDLAREMFSYYRIPPSQPITTATTAR